MHGGFKILHLDEEIVRGGQWFVGEEEGCDIITTFEEHKSFSLWSGLVSSTFNQ